MPSQKKRRNYRTKADNAFGKYIRARGYCESDRDSHAGNLQCAHIISRSYGTIRTNENNALCLCAGCHTFYTHRPLEWRQFIDTEFPGRWDRLTELALTYETPDWKHEAEYWASRI